MHYHSEEICKPVDGWRSLIGQFLNNLSGVVRGDVISSQSTLGSRRHFDCEP